jgi:hypothetical protein
MAEHGLVPPAWRFAWGRGLAAVGRCGNGLIRISRPWAAASGYDLTVIRGWILHEIAHALAGPDKGHGEDFIRACRAVGCDITTDVAPCTPPPKLPYSGECPCGARWAAGRKRPTPDTCPACRHQTLTWGLSDGTVRRAVSVCDGLARW